MMKKEDNMRYKNIIHWSNEVGVENEERDKQTDKLGIVGWEHEVSWSLLKWLLKMIQANNAK